MGRCRGRWDKDGEWAQSLMTQVQCVFSGRKDGLAEKTREQQQSGKGKALQRRVLLLLTIRISEFGEGRRGVQKGICTGPCRD